MSCFFNSFQGLEGKDKDMINHHHQTLNSPLYFSDSISNAVSGDILKVKLTTKRHSKVRIKPTPRTVWYGVDGKRMGRSCQPPIMDMDGPEIPPQGR